MESPRNMVKAQGIWFHFTKFMVPLRTYSWILAFLQTQYCYLKKNKKMPEYWIGFFVSYGELRLFSCTEIWITQFQFTSCYSLHRSNLACFWRFVVLILAFLRFPISPPISHIQTSWRVGSCFRLCIHHDRYVARGRAASVYRTQKETEHRKQMKTNAQNGFMDRSCQEKSSANICYRGCHSWKLFQVQHANSQRNPTFFLSHGMIISWWRASVVGTSWCGKLTRSLSIKLLTAILWGCWLVTILYFHNSMIHIYISSHHSTEAIPYAWPQLWSRCTSSKQFFGEII